MKKLITLDEFVKKFRTIEVAAHNLEVSDRQIRRWLVRKTYAGISTRTLAAQHGVLLPERPINAGS